MNDSKTHGCKCRNCGIELITQNQSADTFCRFCSTPALIAADYENVNMPELVIPFEITKHQARQILLQYLSARPLAVSAFSQKVKNGHFSAMYFPVCLADIEVTADVHALSRDNTEIYRQLTSTAKNVHSGISQILDTFRFRNLGSYSFDKAIAYRPEHAEIPFENPATTAEKATLDIPKDELETASIKEAMDSLGNRENIQKILSCEATVSDCKAKSVLVPVWVLSHTSNGYTHQITVNGQSGEINGEPPISFKRIASIFGCIAAGCTVIGELIWMLVNGI